MVGRAATVLERPRALAFLAVLAAVIAWSLVAPHLPYIGHWWNVALVAAVVLPGTLLLAWLALPLWRERWVWIAALAFGLLALVFSLAGWGLAANLAKLFAAVLAGWAFLSLFEELWWVVLVALVIPFVDLLSVWRGPTHAIVSNPKNFHIYVDVAIAFLVPGGSAASLGPPDVLFYGLFLAAAARWRLRVGWTWAAMTAMYGLTIVIANLAHLGGLAALPFLSFGFFVANIDLLWRRLHSS